MSKILKRESCQKILDVSRETIETCDVYLNELIKWQKNLNLEVYQHYMILGEGIFLIVAKLRDT